jgi:hypothetical protein
VPQAFGDVGVLFTVLRFERDFGSNGNSADHLEASGDIGERVLQIATAGAGFRSERFMGRLALAPCGRMGARARPAERTIVRALRLSLPVAIAGLLGARVG